MTEILPSKEPNLSDPEAEYTIKRTRIGSWEFHEDKEASAVPHPLYVFVHIVDELFTCFPYVIRVLNTMKAICFDSLILFLATSLLQAILPSVSLYYSSLLLRVVQDSIDSRTVDKTLLFSILGCNFTCAAVGHIVALGRGTAHGNISQRMDLHFAEHLFCAKARLDVPTSQNPAVFSPLREASKRDAISVWDGIQSTIGIFFTAVRLVSQLSILLHVLKAHPDGIILAMLSFIEPTFRWIRQSRFPFPRVWGATCRNIDYMRIEGLKTLTKEVKFRKEMVVGDLQAHVESEYGKAQKHLDSEPDSHMHSMRVWDLLDAPQGGSTLLYCLDELLHEIPQIFFTLYAVQSPRSIPISMISLELIRDTVASFTLPVITLVHGASSILRTFTNIRHMYEMANLRNEVIDGTEPRPEQTQTVNTGIGIEFKDVSFKYPDMDKFAIQNVTFKIEPGQLCVLVGFNGSGKSTILKLLTRLYDPTEGIILIDGRDIKTLKMADLRRCIAVLFQDYTHFPLSIKENIGMGNPEHAKDEDMIRQAAALGGAMEIIEGLPEGFHTFLSRPVPDQYSGFSEGSRSLLGSKVDYGRVKRAMGQRQNVKLSGGQMQKLAVSRTFMRSLGSDSQVGLLLFDEPSASLDPESEQDLFERLRRLRGSKTMVFSSHRFGQLTRTADVILYMANSTVLELGTHEELLKLGGGYSRIYSIQAAQFRVVESVFGGLYSVIDAFDSSEGLINFSGAN